MRAHPLLLVACVMALAACSSSVETSSPSPSPAADARGGIPAGHRTDIDEASALIIRSIAPDPVPVEATDGKVHVVYELEVLNVAPRPAAITRVETLAGGPDGAVVATIGADEVAARTLLFPGGTAVPGAEARPVTQIPAGMTGVLLLDGVYDTRADVPAALAHRLSATLGPVTPGAEALGAWFPDAITQIGGDVRISAASPVVLGPPVAGPDWLAVNGCCAMSPHRGATLAVGGRFNGAERYAIDWHKVDTSANPPTLFSGDGARNEDSHSFGAPLLAVADGAVVAVVSDKPDQTPYELPQGLGLDQIGGNLVYLDIGGGNYAFYAHLRQGSPTVKVGDKVAKGQVIGQLGNSGNSSGAHLHFQVTRAPLAISGDNVPYVFDTFAFVGTGDDAGLNRGPNAGARTDQYPLMMDFVDFPPQP